MTAMVPPTIHSSVPSGAERRLFNVIAAAADTDGWRCLHSLGLSHHGRKRRGEIDFLLITPAGMFVLEVKGGRIRRERGQWVYTDRWGVEHRKNESPFDQAASAMFSLERHLREQFANRPRMANVMLGCAVMVPDVQFDALGVEADRRQVYDRRTQEHPFTDFVRGLVEYTRSVQSAPRNGLHKQEIEELVEHLRGDFDLVPVFAVRADDVNEGLRQLTRSQYECLSRANERDRLLVEGSAGTGKTVLALELARREARAGRRVLLLCFNVLLAARLRGAIAEPEVEGAIHVNHLHGYLRGLISEAGLEGEFARARADARDEGEVFRTLYPYYAELAIAHGAGRKFDALILDEGQDVLTSDVLNVLDASLRGGLQAGRWRVFLDSNEQAAVYGNMDPDAYARLEAMAVTRGLGVNCRNTKEIELATRAIARPRAMAAAWLRGESVERRWYSKSSDLAPVLRSLLGELATDRVELNRVTILFPRTPTQEMHAALRSAAVHEVTPEDVARPDGQRTLSWSTVSAFKGLENDLIVLAGVERIDTPWWQAVTYVGMSRARVRLYVVLNEALRPLVEERFEELLRDALKDGGPQ